MKEGLEIGIFFFSLHGTGRTEILPQVPKLGLL